jgi:3-deoxy-D-manno-octulosonic-acid transferase
MKSVRGFDGSVVLVRKERPNTRTPEPPNAFEDVMYWLYSLGLGAFFTGMLPFFGAQAVLRGKYRRGLAERLGSVRAHAGTESPLWLHAVSVGEVMAAAPLARELVVRRPDVPLLVSTVTDTGRRVAEQRLPAKQFLFFPLDFAWIVGRVLDRLHPRLVLLTETELWPNFLAACRARRVPVVLINGRISPRSFPRYRLVARWFSRVLQDIRLFCMQTAQDAERILALGAPPERVRVLGNLKFDLPTLGRDADAGSARLTLGLPPDQRLVVAGSTHRGEEEVILEAFRDVAASRGDLRLLLAPRHPERLAEVEGLIRRAGFSCIRRSRLPAGPVNGAPVILLDTMGELSWLYAAASVVFVGGSLIPHGGQNILEPAAYARPVLHGPHMANFAEMRDLFHRAGAAIQVEDAETLGRRLGALLDEPAAADRMGNAGRAIVEAHCGATRRTADLVSAFL